MKRIIIDFKKLTPELAARFLEKYPGGYGDEDIVAFKNIHGNWVEAVELQTPEALYLVKIGQQLSSLIAYFEKFHLDSDPEAVEEGLPGLENEYDGSLETDLA